MCLAQDKGWSSMFVHGNTTVDIVKSQYTCQANILLLVSSIGQIDVTQA